MSIFVILNVPNIVIHTKFAKENNMENTTVDFAQALIEELQEDNLFDLSEEILIETPKITDKITESQTNKNLSPKALENTPVAQKNRVAGKPLNTVSLELQPNFQTAVPKNEPSDDYKKAIAEISSLNTIEQLIFGVERDQIKANSVPYDTVAINMALLGFQKGSPADEEKVYTEIEKWQCYLLDRDEQISLKDLRIYCETTKLKLSSRAMLTLAGFYQNVSKVKFELLLTRTFSQDDEVSEHRHLFCDSEEIAHHLKEICRESTAADITVKMDLLKQFGEDVNEFESINGMLATDYFGRYQNFKQELGDLFFDSRVLGLIVQNNILIGNHFVTLVEKERATDSKSSLFDKERFGTSFEEAISEVICKTINLDKIKSDASKLNKQKTQKQFEIEKNKTELRAKNAQTKSKTVSKANEEDNSSSGRVVKLILLCLFLTSVIVGIGYFMLGDGLLDGDKMSEADRIQNESNRNNQ